MRAALGVDAGLAGAISAVYDAALAPEAWPRALLEIKGLFGVANTAYLVHDADRSQVARVAAEHDPEGQRLNVDFLLRSARPLYGDRTGYVGQVARIAEIVPAEAFRRSAMYDQFWRPRQLNDALRLTIAIDGAGIHHAINLHRACSAPKFGVADIALGQALMPHLQQAVELRRRLGEASMLAAAAFSVLDTLPHAVLLLARGGRVLHGNAQAEKLLAAGDGLVVRHGFLEARTQPVTHRLHGLLTRAADGSAMMQRAGTLLLPRPGRMTPLAVLVVPFRQDTDWALPGSPAVLMTVTDPHGGVPPSAAHLAALFGWTAAEASVAVDLLCGLSARDIAARRGRSLATVRSQLARLMAKADVGRQSDLVRMLGTLPRVRSEVG